MSVCSSAISIESNPQIALTIAQGSEKITVASFASFFTVNTAVAQVRFTATPSDFTLTVLTMESLCFIFIEDAL
jgi:hypothetical protein